MLAVSALVKVSQQVALVALGAAMIGLVPNEQALGSPIQPAVDISLAQSVATRAIADGIYFYGQSPKANQIGQEYLVLKVERGTVKGVVYQPNSEYSCFTGNVTDNQLSLMVQDPYEKESSPYSIAMLASSPVAGSLPKTSVPNLEGYHPITKVTAKEQQLLNTCLKELR